MQRYPMKSICHPIYMMQMQVMLFNQHPKIHHSTQRAINSPPMLEIFIVRNENDAEKGQGKGEGKERRGKGRE